MSANKFKFIKNVNSQEADILLYNQIGFDVDENGNPIYGIDGEAFAHEMKYLEEKTQLINVRINSIGGSVSDGYSIMSAILNSKVTVYTHIDGLAASIAGVIAMMGQRIFMRDFGTLMLHNPSGGDNVELLNLVKKTLITIFKERRSFDEGAIDKMMNDETWLDADAAKNLGFIDEIVSSAERVPVTIDRKGGIANMALIYNKLINKTENKQTVNKMEAITTKLKLAKNSSEEVVVEKIDAMEKAGTDIANELEAAKAENVTLKKELSDIAEAKETAKTLEITNTMKKYVEAGKLKEDEVEKMVNLAKVDLDGVKNLLDKIEIKKVANIINFKEFAVKNGTEDRSDWSHKDWQIKDSKGLMEMKTKNEVAYKELFNKTYKK